MTASRPTADFAPQISVVVPTCRRPELLARCLDALAAQSLPPAQYEILVVDDGREDAVRALVEARAAAHPQRRLRYLRNTDGHGPAAARNLGWRHARAPLVAFTDDDTLPEPDWLRYGLQAMQHNTGWAAAAGGVVVPPLRPGAALPTDHERMTQDLSSAEFVTASAFVRRDALTAIGGFDERFRRPWHEDTDLQFRLLRQHGPVGRVAAACVVHPVRAERWGVSLRRQRNTYFDALLYKKHPELYRERIRRVPPWDYYAIVAATLAAPLLAAGGHGTLATTALLAAAALVLRLAWHRLARTDRSPGHVAEMLITSAGIPFLSVYWRLRGALHFRVPFL